MTEPNTGIVAKLVVEAIGLLRLRKKVSSLPSLPPSDTTASISQQFPTIKPIVVQSPDIGGEELIGEKDAWQTKRRQVATEPNRFPEHSHQLMTSAADAIAT
ncbi:hypothetical protein OsI_33683 [Oryza sativa Indica Group]|uniref:Uncharacterized protein n=1 Tax=Oryza sativa subsp. indica TaxID=39946 RepID=A2Z7K2_ORYSI|nr:hypothetical protein OsI_33683 [Oryza sativa Indica Group]